MKSETSSSSFVLNFYNRPITCKKQTKKLNRFFWTNHVLTWMTVSSPASHKSNRAGPVRPPGGSNAPSFELASSAHEELGHVTKSLFLSLRQQLVGS